MINVTLTLDSILNSEMMGYISPPNDSSISDVPEYDATLKNIKPIFYNSK